MEWQAEWQAGGGALQRCCTQPDGEIPQAAPAQPDSMLIGSPLISPYRGARGNVCLPGGYYPLSGRVTHAWPRNSRGPFLADRKGSRHVLLAWGGALSSHCPFPSGPPGPRPLLCPPADLCTHSGPLHSPLLAPRSLARRRAERLHHTLIRDPKALQIPPSTPQAPRQRTRDN